MLPAPTKQNLQLQQETKNCFITCLLLTEFFFVIYVESIYVSLMQKWNSKPYKKVQLLLCCGKVCVLSVKERTYYCKIEHSNDDISFHRTYFLYYYNLQILCLDIQVWHLHK